MLIVLVSVFLSLTLEASTYRFRLKEPVQTLDWTRVHFEQDMMALAPVSRGLFCFGPHLEVLPDLVKRASSRQHHRVWDLWLHSDVRWSDGRLFEADDVLFAWQRLLAPTTVAPYRTLLSHIEGAEAVLREAGKWSDLGIKILGPHHLRVHLSRADPQFTSKLALMPTFPMRRDLVSRSPTGFTDIPGLVTLGPFTLTAKTEATLTYARRLPLLEPQKLEARVIQEEGIAIRELTQCRLDSLTGLLEPIGRLPQGLLMQDRILRKVRFLALSARDYPLSQNAIRKAISLVIDPRMMGLPKGALPTQKYLPQVTPQHSPVGPERIQEARTLLSGAGIDTANRIQIPFLVPNDPLSRAIAESVRLQLLEALEIEAVIAIFNRREWDFRTQFQRGAMVLSQWLADDAGSESFFAPFTSVSGQNVLGLQSKKYDFAFFKLTVMPTKASRHWAKAMDRFLVEESALVVPLYQERVWDIFDASFQGFKVDILGNYDFSQLYTQPSRNRYQGVRCPIH